MVTAQAKVMGYWYHFNFDFPSTLSNLAVARRMVVGSDPNPLTSNLHKCVHKVIVKLYMKDQWAVVLVLLPPISS